MKPSEKILELIKSANADSISAEDDLAENFNALLKDGFIDIVDDKIILTEKGGKVYNSGLGDYSTEPCKEECIKRFSVEIQKQNFIKLKDPLLPKDRWFYLLLIIFFVTFTLVK